MKVLIADDEKLIVDDLIREVLELYPDARVDGAVSADAALELAKKTVYDVALLDIDMPGTDGLNLARRLIAGWPTINIIFVTGYKEYALEAHELYCSGFLLKPVGSKKIKEAFENLRKPFIDMSEDILAQHYSGSDVIGRRLEMFREQRGITRQEMADYMGVMRQTIYRWEHGERIPDVLTFIKIIRLLGVEISDIIG